MSSTKKDNGKSSCQKESSSYKRSKLEKKTALILRAEKFPAWVEEHRFCERRWRFDFAWPDQMVALEVEGGVWKGKFGGHTSGKGFTKDCDKYNTATAMGWRVFRITNVHVKEVNFTDWLWAALKPHIESDPNHDIPIFPDGFSF